MLTEPTVLTPRGISDYDPESAGTLSLCLCRLKVCSQITEVLLTAMDEFKPSQGI
jgi:hypothetical protein